MRIALLGYGRMGKEIEAIAIDRGHDIVVRCSSEQPLHESTEDFDVAIDFSLPHTVFAHTALCLDRGVPLVIGTTGWQDKRDVLEELVIKSGGSVIVGSNFSLGMHMFRDVVTTLARCVNRAEDYDIALEEIHHRMKLDAPGGTALTLAERIIDEVQRKKEIQRDASGGHSANALSISSLRVGHVSGTHSVIADSLDDTIEVTHRAKNRQGFARGAVRAAEWICSHHGWYDIADVFDEVVRSTPMPS